MFRFKLVALASLAACSAWAAPPDLPPPANREIDFAREVHPILVSRCTGCHTGNTPQAALKLNTRADLLRGGVGGPSIVAGKSAESLLIQRVTGLKTPIMPMAGEKLSDTDVGILRAWIDQGAKAGSGPQEVSWQPTLAPRKPDLPTGAAREPNALDYFLRVYLEQQKVQAQPAVSDAAFLRRATFDLWGLPPEPGDLAAFSKAAGPDKRARAVDRLLADRARFSEHWISFWNDLLHNDEGVNYIGDRKSITPWLLTALSRNMPYDQMTRSLLNPVAGTDPAGFVMGVNWRGDVSASQLPVMQAAQNSAQVFLGVNLKCNSCHDSFISRWKLKDAYGMASFFSDKPIELVRCDVKTGEMSTPKFLYPELGSVDVNAPVAERRARAAELFTLQENGRFSRTMVNRVWKRLLGRGLVEPADDMDAEPWNPDMLDWLAWEFSQHDYNLDWLLKQIITSRAYQLPAIRQGEKEEKNFVFRGPRHRRITAEQFADAISAITGEWRVLGSKKPEPGIYAREWRFKASPLTRALGRPTRDLAVTERENDPTTLQTLELVNGSTMADVLWRGSRRLAGDLPLPPPSLFDSGVLSSTTASVDVDLKGAKELRLLIVDHDSYDPGQVVAGWMNATLEGPKGSIPLAEAGLPAGAKVGEITPKNGGPGNAVIAAVPSELVIPLAGKGYTWFRATVGVDRQSLRSVVMPNIRFYVFNAAPDRARMGSVQGQPPVAALTRPSRPEQLVDYLFTYALGRKPDPAERAVALEYLKPIGGSPARLPAEGIEDLLWSLFLSPEFQFLT